MQHFQCWYAGPIPARRTYSLVLLFKKEPGGGVSTIITGLAQSVEHGPFKPVAAGSSPAIGIP